MYEHRLRSRYLYGANLSIPIVQTPFYTFSPVTRRKCSSMGNWTRHATGRPYFPKPSGTQTRTASTLTTRTNKRPLQLHDQYSTTIWHLAAWSDLSRQQAAQLATAKHRQPNLCSGAMSFQCLPISGRTIPSLTVIENAPVGRGGKRHEIRRQCPQPIS